MGRFAAVIITLGGLALLAAGVVWLVYVVAGAARRARNRYRAGR